MNNNYKTLEGLAKRMRGDLNKNNKKNLFLLYAYNGTGKTRLSMIFKELGKKNNSQDTLYFNAFTEDLFIWDNDLNNDSERVLTLNSKSFFFTDIEGFNIETSIRELLSRYANFDFKIDYTDWKVNFEREVKTDESSQTKENIKISRGEENMFIWCFFLAIARLAIDEVKAYGWVKYLYIDDPISSLDDNNAIAVAHHLADLLDHNNNIKVVISSHHALFFNVLHNELGSKAHKYFLCKDMQSGNYIIRNTGDTPFFHHVALLKQLDEASKSNKLYTHHFNMLRNILERTASFHGLKKFSDCIKGEDNKLHARIINVLNHGNHSLFEPKEMAEDHKQIFKEILNNFMANYQFNLEFFEEPIHTEQP